MGVYPNVDKTIEIERRFSRGKIPTTVHGNYTDKIGLYDEQLRQRTVPGAARRAPTAVRDHQFQCTTSRNSISSTKSPSLRYRSARPLAAPLARDHHAKGLYPRVRGKRADSRSSTSAYSAETAAQLKLWKEQFGFTVRYRSTSRVSTCTAHIWLTSFRSARKIRADRR